MAIVTRTLYLLPQHVLITIVAMAIVPRSLYLLPQHVLITIAAVAVNMMKIAGNSNSTMKISPFSRS